MELGIFAVGRMKSGPERDMFETYLDRAAKGGRQLGFSGPFVREFAESRAQNPDTRKAEEAGALWSSAGDCYLITLDEHGQDCSSTEFANLLRSRADSGQKRLVLAIGGPDGHGSQLLERANETLRMGRMTWPHQLVRIMLAEQLYRAITILSGHPYHRP